VRGCVAKSSIKVQKSNNNVSIFRFAKNAFSQIIKMSQQNVITSVFIIFTTTVVDDDLDFDNFNIIL